MEKHVFLVTHTQRFTDHSAPQADFVVDDSVSNLDFLCSIPKDCQLASDSKDHTQSDAARILLGYTTREKLEGEVRPKAKKDENKESSVNAWTAFERRMRAIDNLLQDPEFRRIADGIQGGDVDSLTRDANVSVANRVRQIVVPSHSGDRVVSPLHPLGISLLAGDILHQQILVSKFLDGERKKGKDVTPFNIRLVLANRYLSNMQNTGISMAGKKMARMKNFPPSTLGMQARKVMAHPMRLPSSHPAIQGVLKAVIYRHAYVARTGGSVGNGEKVRGKQTNHRVLQRFHDASAYLVNATVAQMVRIRQRFHEMDEPFLARSWPEPVRLFMNHELSPKDSRVESLRALALAEMLDSVSWAAEHRDIQWLDTDRRILREKVTDLIQRKEMV
jgi:hypothetical protein